MMREAGQSPLDRGLQRVGACDAGLYPERLLSFPKEMVERGGLHPSISYLHGHDSCDVATPPRTGLPWRGAKLTARGLDFLEDDGGLSALRLRDSPARSEAWMTSGACLDCLPGQVGGAWRLPCALAGSAPPAGKKSGNGSS
jgi:hypothetical protein